MLAKFPDFKKITLGDKPQIQEITNHFEPYSDFNFASLWSYNTVNEIECCLIYDNLAVKFSDYITRASHCSFLGNKNVEETINILLKYSRQTNLERELKLIPEVNIDHIPDITSKFLVEEDIDNFDYIYFLSDMADLPGQKFAKKRNKINLFKKSYPEILVKNLNLEDSKIQKEIVAVFFDWEKAKGKIKTETENELIAINRLIQSANYFDLQTLGIYYQEKLIGFSIVEFLQNEYTNVHFVKADPNFKGIFEFIYQTTATSLQKRGEQYKYISREQDLGIAGLREAKKQWYPIKYLKKYKISPLI